MFNVVELFQEPISQLEDMSQQDMDDDDSGEERPLYIKEEDDDEKDEKFRVNDEGSMESSLNDTRLSQLHNTTIEKTEESDEDMPLVRSIVLIFIFYLKIAGPRSENWF